MHFYLLLIDAVNEVKTIEGLNLCRALDEDFCTGCQELFLNWINEVYLQRGLKGNVAEVRVELSLEDVVQCCFDFHIAIFIEDISKTFGHLFEVLDRHNDRFWGNIHVT